MRHQILDQLRRGFRGDVEQLLHFLVAEQLVRVRLQEVAQVCGDDAARIDDGIAERLRVVARGRLDPDRLHAEGRILGGDALQGPEDAARVDGELTVDVDDAFAERDAAEGDAVGVRRELEVVADVHRLHEEAELLGELAAHAPDARQQLAALGLGSTSGTRR